MGTPYKLTKEQIADIVWYYKNSPMTIVELAKKYGVALYTIQFHLYKNNVSKLFMEQKRMQAHHVRNRWLETEAGKKLRQMHSERMKKNNPMFNPMTKQKMTDTITKRGHVVSEWTFKKGHLPVKRDWHTHTPEMRKRISQWSKGNTSHLGKHHSDETKEVIRQKRLMQKFPKKATQIELKMAEELRKRGIEFEQNKSALGICQPDFWIKDSKVFVQCDGDYWHSRPEIITKDLRQDSTLRKEGYSVIRFSETEINENIEACVDEVDDLLLLRSGI